MHYLFILNDAPYGTERSVGFLTRRRRGVCGTCMDGRGIKAEMLTEGTHRSSMDELSTWTAAADKILIF